MRFHCIADEDTVRGFRLAGVEGRAVASAAEAAAALRDACSRPDCGLLIVTSPVVALVRAEIDAIRLDRGRPLVVEVPGPAGAASVRRSLGSIVQEAVGIRLDPETGA